MRLVVMLRAVTGLAGGYDVIRRIAAAFGHGYYMVLGKALQLLAAISAPITIGGLDSRPLITGKCRGQPGHASAAPLTAYFHLFLVWRRTATAGIIFSLPRPYFFVVCNLVSTAYSRMVGFIGLVAFPAARILFVSTFWPSCLIALLKPLRVLLPYQAVEASITQAIALIRALLAANRTDYHPTFVALLNPLCMSPAHVACRAQAESSMRALLAAFLADDTSSYLGHKEPPPTGRALLHTRPVAGGQEYYTTL